MDFHTVIQYLCPKANIINATLCYVIGYFHSLSHSATCVRPAIVGIFSTSYIKWTYAIHLTGIYPLYLMLFNIKMAFQSGFSFILSTFILVFANNNCHAARRHKINAD